MLIQFQIKNYRTFKESAMLSLVASNYDKQTLEDENVVKLQPFKLRLLKSAAIMGANASGKTKLIEAIRFMRHFVVNSSKETQQGEEIPVMPFLLSTVTERKPSEFELSFFKDDRIFRYGFEVDRKRVVAEWLYTKKLKDNGKVTKEIELFCRGKSEFSAHKTFSKGGYLYKEGMVRDNALFLSVAAQFNDPTAIAVMNYFRDLRVISELDAGEHERFSLAMINDPELKPRIMEFLSRADIEMGDIQLRPFGPDSVSPHLPEEIRQFIIEKLGVGERDVYDGISTFHDKYNQQNKKAGSVRFSLEDDESTGTRRYLSLAGVILDVIKHGKVLVVDELDSSLHPRLVNAILSLFNSKKENPHNAQLIFNTHSLSILDSGVFRRDQIWFVEKDRFGASSLSSLSDFKLTQSRKGERYATNYLRGKYGGVPFVTGLGGIIEN